FTTKFEGRGLGLASVGGIARSHGWAVRIESVKGRGTRVLVLFPQSQQPAQDSAPLEPDDRPGLSGRRVLLIDDDERVRFTLELILAKLGCAVRSAASGAEGVTMFEAEDADVVLLDLTMPGLGGIETLTLLRAVRPAVRVVLMSGFSVEEARSRFSEQAPAAFLPKPFTTDALAVALTEAMSE